MADGQMNIRVNVDLNDMRRKAEEYRKEVTKMGLVTDESGNVISTAWQRVSDAAKKSNIGRIAEEMTGDVSANIEIQKKVLKDLEEQYKSVSKAVENAAPGTAKSKLQQELSAIKKEIDGEKQALQELEKVQQQYNQSNATLRTQIYNVRNEMGRLRMQGQTNTEQYRQLEAELGRLGTAYRQLQYEQKALSTGATQWGGIISGIQGLTGAFATAQGVIGLFVTDNEKLAKIQTRLQAVMAITIGMQQVSNTLHATSAFRMTTVRKITELYTAAQGKLQKALFGSAAAAKVLMGTLTLGLAVAIPIVISWIDKLRSAQKKAAEEQKHILDTQKKQLEGVGEQTAVYEKLRKQWNDLADNMEAKKKFIEENKDEFEKLGIAIGGVDDAENLLVRNKDAFIKSLNERAMAAASYQLAVEKYQEVLKKQADLEKMPVTKAVTKSNLKSFGRSTLGQNTYTEITYVENEEYTRLKKEIENAKKAADSFIKKNIDSVKKTKDILTEAGFTTTEEEKAKKEAEKLAKEQAEKERKAAEARKKTLEKISQELLALERKNQQSRINLMEEGREKELAQIEKDYEEKISKIKELAEKWASEQGGTLTVKQNIEITAAYSNAKKEKELKESKIWKNEVDAERKAMQEYIKEYGTYQEKRLIITKQYAEKIVNARTIGEKMSLEKERDKAIQDLDQSMIEQKDFWTRLFSDASEHTNKYISQIIADTEKLIDYINDKTGDVKLPDFITKEQADALKKDPEKVKTILEELKKKKEELNTRNPFRGMIDGFKDLFNAGDDAEKQMASLNDVFSSMGAAVAIINQVGDALSDMGISAGSAMKEVTGVISNTMSMAQTGASLGGPVGAAVGAGLGLASSVIKLFSSKKDKKHDREIAKIQKQIDALEKEYGKVQEKTETSYSSNKVKSIEKESTLLEQQNRLMQQQIKEEQAKKKTDKNKIEEWNKAIEANREQIEKNKQLAIDAIFGEDLQSAIENFATAYANAWASGEDRAKSARDTVKKMMQSMVTESIKAAIQSSSKMEEIRKKLTEFYTDNVLSGWEQDYIYNMAEELQKELDQQFGWAESLLKGDEEQAKRQTGTISETITEKTATESMGIWRGSYDTLKSISQQTTMFHETYKSTMATCNSILNTIARNTGQTADNTSVLSGMHDTLKSMDGRLRSIENNNNKKYTK